MNRGQALPSYALHMLLVPNRRPAGEKGLPSGAGQDRADVGRTGWITPPAAEMRSPNPVPTMPHAS